MIIYFNPNKVFSIDFCDLWLDNFIWHLLTCFIDREIIEIAKV